MTLLDVLLASAVQSYELHQQCALDHRHGDIAAKLEAAQGGGFHQLQHLLRNSFAASRPRLQDLPIDLMDVVDDFFRGHVAFCAESLFDQTISIPDFAVAVFVPAQSNASIEGDVIQQRQRTARASFGLDRQPGRQRVTQQQNATRALQALLVTQIKP